MTVDVIEPLASILALIVGLLFGSFLNVCIYRLPAGRSIVSPGSRCPHCGAAVRAWQNVPVLSWLALRAAARRARPPSPGATRRWRR